MLFNTVALGSMEAVHVAGLLLGTTMLLKVLGMARPTLLVVADVTGIIKSKVDESTSTARVSSLKVDSVGSRLSKSLRSTIRLLVSPVMKSLDTESSWEGMSSRSLRASLAGLVLMKPLEGCCCSMMLSRSSFRTESFDMISLAEFCSTKSSLGFYKGKGKSTVKMSELTEQLCLCISRLAGPMAACGT